MIEDVSCRTKHLQAKLVNTYNAYDLDAKFWNCLFAATSILKNSDKERLMYSGYGIAFYSAGSWNFDDDFARNVVIFSADNSSSSWTDSFNNFLILMDTMVNQK